MTQPSQPPAFVGGRVLDVGALAHAATGGSIYARALLTHANARGQAIVVSSVALAAARAASGAGGRGRLHVLLDLAPVVTVPFGIGDAEDVGDLLATAGAEQADLAAGHVVWLGLRRHQRVVTDRPGLLRGIAPDIEVDELP